VICPPLDVASVAKSSSTEFAAATVPTNRGRQVTGRKGCTRCGFSAFGMVPSSIRVASRPADRVVVGGHVRSPLPAGSSTSVFTGTARSAVQPSLASQPRRTRLGLAGVRRVSTGAATGAPSHRVASCGGKGGNSTAARQRPGRTIAGCRRAISSLVVSRTSTFMPWPRMPSARLSSRPSAAPASLRALARRYSSLSSAMTSRQMASGWPARSSRRAHGRIRRGRQDLGHVRRLPEELLRVGDVLGLAPRPTRSS
jgi:hypothetical protein